jgi:hypothetical protein
VRRVCDVCGLIEAEHPDRLGNDCYRRIVAAHFPVSAVDRYKGWSSPLEAQKAKERAVVLQTRLAGFWKALARA